ncbi:hypothetical protein [Mycobacterium sp.]|uniref:hypothetical protein n=1 Tax=Mycobacterium sp. TaxID=1785 RepID=UPI003BB18B26
MNAGTQKVSAWCGPIFCILFGLGWMALARWVQPPSPNLSAASIADVFASHRTLIRLGVGLGGVAGAISVPWAAVVAVQMKRIEGENCVMTYTQLTTGALGALIFIFPMLFLEVAAFRADRSAELVQAVSDLGYLCLIGFPFLAVIQAFALTAVIFQDHRATPIFPRWLGYFSLWAGTLFIPGTAISYFHTGPLAWNGIFAYWLPLGVFAIWIAVVTAYVLRAIDQQQAEDVAADSAIGSTKPVHVG